jgi:endonuclease YncB( thermonuclease family)
MLERATFERVDISVHPAFTTERPPDRSYWQLERVSGHRRHRQERQTSPRYRGFHRSRLLPHTRPSLREDRALKAPSAFFIGEPVLLDSARIRIIDGDTFAYGATRIRIRGLNAPELSQPGGAEATRALAALLSDQAVTVIPKGEDVYRRMLADVFVGGKNVAEQLKRSDPYSSMRG